MSNHIETVRSALLDTLADLRNKANPMDLSRAKAVAEIASVLVDTARVENDYLKITRQSHSAFLDNENNNALPKPSDAPTPHNPFPVSKRNNPDDFETERERQETWAKRGITL